MATACNQGAPFTGVTSPSIRTKAISCRENFSKSLELMDSKQEIQYAYALRKLQAKFSNSMGYLGVFAAGSASLDERLKQHPQYQSLLFLALDMLNMNLIQTMAGEDEDEGLESDGSSDKDEDQRQIQFTGIQKWINELDRLAIYIRRPSISSLDSRVEALAAKKPMEISSFGVKAVLVVNTLYPEASKSVRDRISKSMTKRYTRLLYWKLHDRKLRVDNYRQEQLHDHEKQTQLNPTAVLSTQTMRQERSTKEHQYMASNLKSGKPHRADTLPSETIPSTIVSRLKELQRGVEAPVQKQAGASTVLRCRAQFPSPPRFEDDEDRKPCPFCRKIFDKTNFEDVGWWTYHVNEDLSPFVCISSTCSVYLNFNSRTDWIAHMEREHGIFWSQNSAKSNELPDICPLCYLHLRKPKDAHISQDPESEPLDPQEGGSKVVTASDKKSKKSARFNVEGSSDLVGEANPLSVVVKTSKVDERESRREAEIKIMLHHIADHLQFLALLTPRLSVDKLSTGENYDFPSAVSLSNNGTLANKRSTVDDEFEKIQGDEVREAGEDSVPYEDTPLRETETPTLPAQMPIDWDDYPIPKPTTTKDDTIENFRAAHFRGLAFEIG